MPGWPTRLTRPGRQVCGPGLVPGEIPKPVAGEREYPELGRLGMAGRSGLSGGPGLLFLLLSTLPLARPSGGTELGHHPAKGSAPGSVGSDQGPAQSVIAIGDLDQGDRFWVPSSHGMGMMDGDLAIEGAMHEQHGWWVVAVDVHR